MLRMAIILMDQLIIPYYLLKFRILKVIRAGWGSEVDLGVLETMGLHIAAASINCTIPSDIFGELVRVLDLITQGIFFDNGAARVPSGRGLGIDLDQAAM